MRFSLMLVVVSLLSLLCCVDRAAFGRPRSISVDKLGAQPNKRVDSAPAVRKAIQMAMRAGGGVVRFGPGKYYMMSSPDNIYVLWPKGAKDLHIVGVKGKTELIVTNPHLGLLRFDRSVNCSLRNVICDYETPPFTQGRIVAVDRKAGTFDLKLDEGFPTLDAPFFNRGREWGMPIHPTEPRPKHCWLDHIWIRDWKPVADRTWRLFCQAPANARELDVGDRYVQLARQKNHTIFGAWHSSRITMEDIVVHASPGITNGVVMSDAVVFRRFQVRFRKGTNRVITSNGDGIHVHGNRRGPLIEDCYFEGISDDGVNLNSHMNPIVRVEKDSQIVVEKGPVIFKKGDSIQIFDPDTGTVKAVTTAVAVKTMPGGRVALKLKDKVEGMRPNSAFTPAARGQRRGRGRRRGTGRVDGDLLYNLSASNQGFVIRGNTFRGHRRHGLLIRSGSGLIEKNTFDRICGSAILIKNGGVLEGPVASDVIIRENRLISVARGLHYGRSAQYGAIMVRTNMRNHKLATGRGIRNIQILNNEIIDPPRNAIYIGAASNVTVTGNTVTATEHTGGHGADVALRIENAAGVVVSGLTYNHLKAGVEAGVLIRADVDAGEKGVILKDLELKLHSDTPKVQDQRTP